MSRKHRRNMQHRVFENNMPIQAESQVIEEEIVVEQEQLVIPQLFDNPIVAEEVIMAEPVVEFSHGDIAVPMAEEPIVVEPIIEKPISQYNDKDFVVVENEGQVFPVKYARAKAMGYKVLRKL
jgi:hypothetical protein